MKVQRRCGTPAGYAEHLRKAERPCRYCLPANSTYTNEEIQGLVKNFQEHQRDKLLWSQYGLSYATFARILASQDNRCACCRTTGEKTRNGWHVDHDPDTRGVRGILCSDCSTGLKLLGGNVLGVQRALKYLQTPIQGAGHPRDNKPPQYRSITPKPSKRMLECFNLFSRGVPPNKAIVALKMTPDTMNEIYSLWLKRDGHAMESAEHYLRVIKEPPQRCYCVCGYEVLFEENIDSLVKAIDSVNEHILNSQSAAMKMEQGQRSF
jgi:hypothetical protein